VNYAESIKSIPGFDTLISLKTGLSEHKMEMNYNNSITIHGTADYIKPRAFITDLKFSAQISDFEINKMFADYEYHIRAALYLDLWNYNNPNEKIDTFVYIIVQKSENPVARFLIMSERDIDQGRLKYKQRADKISEAYRSGEWIQNSMEPFELQGWVHEKQSYF
ncbi:MAG: PD-(D/E)XK nuclease-like domain-containing protein, partial [Bacteroidota bacterium]